MYQSLDANKTLETLDCLIHRIEERFPESGLKNVASELKMLAFESKENIEWIARPNYWLRGFLVSVIVLAFALLFFTIAQFRLEFGDITFADLIQIVEAAINDIVLIAASLFFLVSLETRIKRSKALEKLHQLRAITHVIDMHQLTKDPSVICKDFGDFTSTQSSPKRLMTSFELQRYLDYCSELLSLVGKVAALYVQDFPDSVVTQSVNDIEVLCTSLSRNIWQKIAMLKD